MNTESQIETKRALGHLRRLFREGREMLDALEVDNAHHGRWCSRVERCVQRVFPLPLNYRHAFRISPAGVRSPLDMLADDWEPEPPRLKPIGADRITRQWLVTVASALERMELIEETRATARKGQ